MFYAAAEIHQRWQKHHQSQPRPWHHQSSKEAQDGQHRLIYSTLPPLPSLVIIILLSARVSCRKDTSYLSFEAPSASTELLQPPNAEPE